MVCVKFAKIRPTRDSVMDNYARLIKLKALRPELELTDIINRVQDLALRDVENVDSILDICIERAMHDEPLPWETIH